MPTLDDVVQEELRNVLDKQAMELVDNLCKKIREHIQTTKEIFGDEIEVKKLSVRVSHDIYYGNEKVFKAEKLNCVGVPKDIEIVIKPDRWAIGCEVYSVILDEYYVRVAKYKRFEGTKETYHSHESENQKVGLLERLLGRIKKREQIDKRKDGKKFKWYGELFVYKECENCGGFIYLGELYDIDLPKNIEEGIAQVREELCAKYADEEIMPPIGIKALEEGIVSSAFINTQKRWRFQEAVNHLTKIIAERRCVKYCKNCYRKMRSEKGELESCPPPSRGVWDL